MVGKDSLLMFSQGFSATTLAAILKTLLLSSCHWNDYFQIKDYIIFSLNVVIGSDEQVTLSKRDVSLQNALLSHLWEERGHRKKAQCATQQPQLGSSLLSSLDV